MPNWMSPRYDPGIMGPNDWIIETFSSAGDANETITLLTDTTYVSHAKFVIPISADATPTAANVATIGASVAYNGENVAHRVLILGGNGSGGRAVVLQSTANRHPKPGSIYWAIVPAAAAVGNVRTLTAASLDNSEFVKLEIVIPLSEVQGAGAAPDARATGVSDIVAATATISTNGATDSVGALVGGYIDNYVADHESYRAYILPAAEPGKVMPGDLILEVVEKTLASASPSTVTLTASADCEFVDVIKVVIPVNTNATLGAISAVVAAGGATAALQATNTVTHVVRCLVLGYAL